MLETVALLEVCERREGRQGQKRVKEGEEEKEKEEEKERKERERERERVKKDTSICYHRH